MDGHSYYSITKIRRLLTCLWNNRISSIRNKSNIGIIHHRASLSWKNGASIDSSFDVCSYDIRSYMLRILRFNAIFSRLIILSVSGVEWGARSKAPVRRYQLGQWRSFTHCSQRTLKVGHDYITPLVRYVSTIYSSPALCAPSIRTLTFDNIKFV